jgi:hypothetical protein
VGAGLIQVLIDAIDANVEAQIASLGPEVPVMDEPRGALLEDTIQFWQPRTSRPLTPEDARQAVENIVGFFTTLQNWTAAAGTHSSEADANREAA